MQDKDEAFKKQLIEQYLEGKATEKELMAFFGLLHRQELDELLLHYMDADFEAARLGAKKITARRNISRRWMAAASILLIFSAGGYLLLHKKQAVQQIARNQTHDIAPGKQQVTLTLANGQKVAVNSQVKGKLAQQGNMAVNINSKALTYTAVAALNVPTATEYNTLTTARGQESPVPLILADGTQVWLNAASSITYPVAFTGKNRVVKITGEVVIKVFHDAAHPFKLIVRGQKIDDIGTYFNVNAYDDEPVIKTTLIDGSIRLSNTTGSVILHPGQAAVVQPESQQIKVSDADVDEALAWKNGYFIFDHEGIQSIMRKVSRWYNVDVEYQGAVSTDWFGGSVSRFKNVSEVLRKLELTGQIHFKIDGQKIIVMK